MKDQIETQKEIAARLREARENMGLSRRQLGEKTSIPMRTIEKYEQGSSEIGSSRLKQFCDVLEVTPDFLFFGETSDDDEPSSVPPAPTTVANDPSALLDELDDLRLSGFENAQRRTLAIAAALPEAFAYIEIKDILELAISRMLHEVSPEVFNIPDATDFGALMVLQVELEEIARRIVDTAIFGVDLYSIEVSALKPLAEKFEIETGWFSVDQKNLISDLREPLGLAFVFGEPIEFEDEKQFPRVK